MKVGTQISIVGKTDVGLQRTENEDALEILDAANLCIVADGMGGHLGGEVASSMVSQAILEAFQGGWESDDPQMLVSRLMLAIEEANSAIHTRGNREAQLRNMGTTVVATLFVGSVVIYASVGDSRIYRFRNGVLEQLTEDHSWVGELRKRNLISEEDARNHPLRNIITRALGMDPEVVVDAEALPAASGDVYLLCSDGLTDLVTDDEIRATLANANDLEAAVDELIEMANDYGGSDNITVGLCRIDPSR